MGPPPRIELDDVRVLFDGHAAVDGVSLSVPVGTFLVLVGASGSGKTTTLKLINRLTEATSGRVRVDGEDVLDLDPVRLRRRIGWAIQRVGLLPHRTVADNVALVPRLLGWAPGRIVTRVAELLELVDLPPARFASRMPADLSGGEQQRVGLARAMAGGPEILLLDEPFGALDARTRLSLQDDVRAWHERFGLTTVMVTHDMTAALRLADQVAVMSEGRVQQLAAPQDLWRAPANEVVAELLAVPRAHAAWLTALESP